ncbi:hypothetical protein [Rathayibacter rathayi]|uniref:hypothetical protein n=1 Tax=Rathayibacter rathayi TaxID=33887 RepID=UPI000CE75C39|nr:hypothetical protein [Rathayibacter rathayi]PPG66284.1 hypothetical protein C5C02_11725 [Rathayibacter rathayi]
MQALHSSQALNRVVASITEATAGFTVATTASGVGITWRSNSAAVAITGGTATLTRPGMAGHLRHPHRHVHGRLRNPLGRRRGAGRRAARRRHDGAARSGRDRDPERRRHPHERLDAVHRHARLEHRLERRQPQRSDRPRRQRRRPRTIDIDRPATGSPAIDVVVRATATSGSVTRTRDFTLRVQPLPAGIKDTQAYV